MSLNSKFIFFNSAIHYKSLTDIILHKINKYIKCNFFLCPYRDFVEAEMFGPTAYDESGGSPDQLLRDPESDPAAGADL